MIKKTSICGLVFAVGVLGVIFQGSAWGTDVQFSTAAPGQNKAITEWGIEVAWINADNLRQSRAHMHDSEIDVVFANFWPKYALSGGGNLSASAKADIDNQIAAASSLPNAAWAIGVDITGTDPYYFPGGTFSAQRWHDLMDASKDYYESASGKPVVHAMIFNEADFWAGQGTPSDLNNVALLLAANPNFTGVGIMGPSTLSSGFALNDYNAAKVPLTHGSTHQLQNWASADTTAAFYQYVAAQGDTPYAPELHSLGEAIFSAEYGVEGGAWWAGVLRARGLFVRSCQGDRLGYGENRPNSSAAAVYRAPGGELYGFAGCFERHGFLSPYRFVCTDRDVYYNGIGPIREYVLPVNVNQDAFVNIETNNPMPALDGHRWKIVNRYNSKVVALAGSSVADGADIQMETDSNSPNQKWDILRFKDGYYVMYNASSGKPMDNYNWSTWDNGNVAQWSDTGGFNQRWFIENAGNGYYHIRNGHGTLYVDGFNTSVIQWSANGETWQDWQFVLADPAVSDPPTARYAFEGNVNDSVGSNNGTAFGSPAYVAVQGGQAIDLDGVNDYVKLPSGIANVDDITIAAWVKWDGGDAQQRIFDFGNNTTEYMFLTPTDFDGQMRFAITTGSYQNEDILITDGLAVGQWVHVAVTLRGNTGILYINGSPKVAGYISWNPSDFNPVKNYIGDSQWPDDPFFNGKIDDFRIYAYALEPANIATLASVGPDALPPAAPTGLSAVGSDAQISLSWNSVPNATSYAVKYSTTDGGPYAPVQNPTSTNAVHMGLNNGTAYYYAISATVGGVQSTNSTQVSAVPSPAILPEEFLIADHAVQGGTNLSLTASNSVPGHLYDMQATDTLLPAVWTSIDVKAGTGSNLLFDVPIDPASPSRYFRLDVQRQ